MLSEILIEKYIAVLKSELVPALGCTEPIAIAYSAARATKLLGKTPQRVEVHCSGNIIKNAKSVVVPNTGGLKGIETSAIIGAIAGDSDKKLEVLTDVSDADVERCKELIATADYCKVKLLQGCSNLHIMTYCYHGDEYAMVEIVDKHINIVNEELNGEVVFNIESQSVTKSDDRSFISIENILTFAKEVELDKVRKMLDNQIECNVNIAEEGLRNDYGAKIGKTLLEVYGNDVKTRAKAYAAAGSDARMSGCVLPVVINSGSGNQGMTVSLPVIVYAQELGVTKDVLYRALIISNLVAIHQKTGIGRLSAYCGAVSAACGAAAAITYLHGGDYAAVTRTITNTLANVSGIVCDGAKPSCAAKIASSVDAGIMGHYMSAQNNSFMSGDGLVKGDVENTIASITRMGRDGMKITDIEILNIMIDEK